LVIEGLSLARTQKEEFNSIIVNNDGNIEALFENLNKFLEN
jgi:phospholipid transport system substrate-binding protein